LFRFVGKKLAMGQPFQSGSVVAAKANGFSKKKNELT